MLLKVLQESFLCLLLEKLLPCEKEEEKGEKSVVVIPGGQTVFLVYRTSLTPNLVKTGQFNLTLVAKDSSGKELSHEQFNLLKVMVFRACDLKKKRESVLE
jgi:hypothetical protein